MEFTSSKKYALIAIVVLIAAYAMVVAGTSTPLAGSVGVVEAPQVATFLSVSLGLAAAIVAFVCAYAGIVSAGLLIASLGLGAALAAAVAAVAAYIYYRRRKYGWANTVAW